MDFSETIVIYDLKLATDDRSDKKFLLTSKLCPLWAVCLLPALGLYTCINPCENKTQLCVKAAEKRIFKKAANFFRPA